MRYLVSRRFVLSGLSSAVAIGAAQAGPPTSSLRPRMRGEDIRVKSFGGPDAPVQKSGLSGEAAFAVADVKTGLILENLNGSKALPPASVTKVVTALYALDALGSEHRFRTQLLITGGLSNGILKGDLILAGGGDPTLDTIALAGMAKQLKSSGVREVRGAFKVYDGALPRVQSIDAEQPDHVGYNPSVSGIALNFNRVHFEWKRTSNGYGVTMDARAAGYRPDVQTSRMSVVRRQLPVYTYANKNGVDTWTVASQALGKGGSRWLPVRNPGAYAGDVFRTLARAQGIVLPRAQVVRSLPGGAQPLVQHSSAPLRVIVYDMLKFSNNLTAEMVGLSASLARDKRPSGLRASAGDMSSWAARTYGMKGTRLVDHSGLGDSSRMRPDDLVTALVKVRQRGILRPLLKPISVRDTKGRVVKGHPIKVNAKTGTLNFVSGLGGFMTAADGTEMAFAILTADTQTRARVKRADREIPQGAREWNRRSKRLQNTLIVRWGALYGS